MFSFFSIKVLLSIQEKKKICWWDHMWGRGGVGMWDFLGILMIGGWSWWLLLLIIWTLIFLLMKMETGWGEGWRVMGSLTFILITMFWGDLLLSFSLGKVFGVLRPLDKIISLFGQQRGGKFSLVITLGGEVNLSGLVLYLQE